MDFVEMYMRDRDRERDAFYMEVAHKARMQEDTTDLVVWTTQEYEVTISGYETEE